jgi:hypothetical protein
MNVVMTKDAKGELGFVEVSGARVEHNCYSRKD